MKARGRDTRTEGGFPRLRYRHHRRRGGLYPGLSNTRKSATWSPPILSLPFSLSLFLSSPFPQRGIVRSLTPFSLPPPPPPLTATSSLRSLLSLSLAYSPSSLSLFPRFTVPQSRQNSAQVHVARCILSRGNALRGNKGPSFVGPFWRTRIHASRRENKYEMNYRSWMFINGYFGELCRARIPCARVHARDTHAFSFPASSPSFSSHSPSPSAVTREEKYRADNCSDSFRVSCSPAFPPTVTGHSITLAIWIARCH